jgi:AraC family transcriptional regulator
MNVRIEKKPAFKIVGAKQSFRNDTGENKVPDFWTYLPRATYDLIIAQAISEPTGMLGLCANFEGKNEFDYYIAVSSNKPTPAGLEEIKIPSSEYRRAKNSIPDLEVYFDYDFPKANFTYELWYPVIKE